MDLPLNSLESLVLFADDFGTDWTGPKLPLALHRSALSEIPPAPHCLLPPPGRLSLHARLGTMLSQGRVGAVYRECYIHRNDQGFSIPPLVAKIANPLHAGDLAKEAAMYQEMLCLQGSAIPRCYGFFKFRRLGSFDFGPVCVLLLEKLGERLPLGQGPDSFPPSLVQHLRDVASDLIQLGIRHDDICFSNILFPSLPSSFTKRAYGWRFIDFDLAVKIDNDVDTFQRFYDDYLGRVIDNIPFGYTVEPWGVVLPPLPSLGAEVEKWQRLANDEQSALNPRGPIVLHHRIQVTFIRRQLTTPTDLEKMSLPRDAISCIILTSGDLMRSNGMEALAHHLFFIAFTSKSENKQGVKSIR
ncbi:hypothetical protein ABKN59_009522 [Abortiporus biennis]